MKRKVEIQEEEDLTIEEFEDDPVLKTQSLKIFGIESLQEQIKLLDFNTPFETVLKSNLVLVSEPSIHASLDIVLKSMASFSQFLTAETSLHDVSLPALVVLFNFYFN